MSTFTQTIVEEVDNGIPLELLSTFARPEQSSIRTIDPPAETNAAEDESQYPTGTKFKLIILSVGLVLILSAMDSSIVSVAVPSITNHFHTIRDVGWYAAAYRLTLCSFQFMFGKLYKLYSLKRIFLVSVAIFMLGSVLCAAAPTSAALVAGRAVSGFASAGILSGTFYSLVQTLPLRKRPLWGSILAAIEGIAEIGSPLFGGALVERLGWRWCFIINIPLCFITFIALLFFLQDTKPAEEMPWKEKLAQLDLLSNAFFVPSITCLFMALGWAGSRNAWNSSTIIVLFAAFVLLLGGFAFLQHRRQDGATLPPRLLRNRSVLAGFLFSLCCNSTIQVVQYYLPTYLQSIRGYTAGKSGVMMLPIIIGFLTAMLVQGWGVSLLGHYVPFMLLGSILMPLFAGLLTTLTTGSSLAKIICYTGFMGFAAGIGFQSPQTAVQTSLPVEDASMGLAVIIFAQHFGPAVFLSAAQSIFTNRLEKNLVGIGLSLNATSIESMGLADLKKHLGADKLQQVLDQYDHSLVQTWYLSVALGCATIIGSLAMEWRSVKKSRAH